MNSSYDVVIVGGAIMGSALAYFLAKDPGFGGSVLVIERDPCYQRCSTTLSAGSIRQQFSTRENILISQFGVQFLRGLGEELAVDGDRPEANFREDGYLLLASQSGARNLQKNHKTQIDAGAPIDLLDANALQQRFPWLSTNGVALATFGSAGEGWFDAYSLLQALKRKSRSLRVEYRQDEVCAIQRNKNRVETVSLLDGTRIDCGLLVNAAGPNCRAVAAMANLEIPVESRKRFVYVFHCREMIASSPLVVDPSGIYFRPEGSHFICGISPDESEDPECFDFDVDYAPFEQIIWPKLAERVPAFEAIKLVNAWAGHYAYNTFDQNAILGPHPEVGNFYFMNGFSGHGLQQAPAIGRAVAELITYGDYRSLNLDSFAYQRLWNDQPVRELNVI